jgi:RNA polymerase sigma-70 factor (ECF subfamily)
MNVWVMDHAAAADDTCKWDAMQRYACGDNGAYSEVYAQLAPPLHRFCLRLCAGTPEADDLLQETLLKLHRARASYRPELNPLHWGYAIARSAYVDRLRRRKARPEAQPLLKPQQDAAQASDSPEAELRAVQLKDAIVATLSLQPEAARTAYILVRLQGVSIGDAAGVLGTSADAVKQRVHRVAEALRHSLQSQGLDVDG